MSLSRAEMIAKLREHKSLCHCGDLSAIADTLEREQLELVRVRDEMEEWTPMGKIAPESEPAVSSGQIRYWADALSKLIGDGK